MEFFDRKEQILDIQLTPYGKMLLSRGELNPVYYSFEDDDILYDSQYGGYTENQKDSHSRITGSVYLKPQHKFSPFGSGSVSFQEVHKNDFDRTNILSLGNAVQDDEVPSWEINFIKGQISSSSNILSGNLGNAFIPQINLKELMISTHVQNTSQEFNADSTMRLKCEDDTRIPFEDFTFSDGSKIVLKKDELIIEILENNNSALKDNFDIECYEVLEDGILRKLKFTKPLTFVENDILLDEEDLNLDILQEIDENMVEYFFDIQIDEDIKELK